MRVILGAAGRGWRGRVALGVLALGVMGATVGCDPEDAPDIDIWYGNIQPVGQPGHSQEWANVLGRVTDEDAIVSLTWALNDGEERPLTIGPADNPRLVDVGDFNVEIDRDELVSGANKVHLRATDQAGNTGNATVFLDHTPATVWPLPALVDWSTATEPTDVVDVIDGRWTLTPAGVRSSYGYDRAFAVGDQTWTDYEVEVPVTVHSMNDQQSAVGFFMRWTGHTEEPPHQPGMQPRVGWTPSGALAWYRGSHGHDHRVELLNDDESFLAADDSGFTLSPGSTYIFRASVERTAAGDEYDITVFPAGQPESSGVTVHGVDAELRKDNGSVLFLAYRADVTFGDVVVTEIDGEAPPPPENQAPTAVDDAAATTVDTPVDIDVLANDGDTDGFLSTSSVTVVDAPTNGGATVDPATGVVTYTPDAGYIGDDSFTYTVDDDDGATSNVATATVSVTEEPPPPTETSLVTDEFSTPAFGEHWTWTDPVGDATHAATGSHADLSVPEGVPHDLWTGALDAPRLLQAANDTDFTAEVKIDSPVTAAYQMQGLVVQEDADDLLRFEVHHDGASARVFAATIDDGAASARANVASVAGGPFWLRLDRTGDTWTLEQSADGTSWQVVTSFDHELAVSSAGLFVGNAGSAPQHTASFDYFRVT